MPSGARASFTAFATAAVLAIAALAFLLYFGIQGGEYATTDLVALRRQEASERAQVQRLRLVVTRAGEQDAMTLRAESATGGGLPRSAESARVTIRVDSGTGVDVS